MTFYLAFSISGTNCFITAFKTAGALSDLGSDFSLAGSRRPDYNPIVDGYKIHYNRLLTKKGQPLRSAPAVMKVFNELKKQGWVVDSQRFIDKHWKKK